MMALLEEQELRPGLLQDLQAADLDLLSAQQRFDALEAELRKALTPKPKPSPPVAKPAPAVKPLVAPKKEVPKPKPKPKPKPQPVFVEPEPAAPEPSPVKRELDIREKLRLMVHCGGANPLAEVVKPPLAEKSQYVRPAGMWGGSMRSG